MGRRKKIAGRERRKFIRLNYTSPLALKVCKKETVSKILNGYTSNVSQSGLLCDIKERVKLNDILWLSFDRATLEICAEIERNNFIYQGGIVGKVVRITRKPNGVYSVAVQFMTREERNLTYVFPQIKFLRRRKKDEPATAEDEEESESLPLEEMEIGDRQQKKAPAHSEKEEVESTGDDLTEENPPDEES
jgi:hypothetical protein